MEDFVFESNIESNIYHIFVSIESQNKLQEKPFLTGGIPKLSVVDVRSIFDSNTDNRHLLTFL